MRPNSRPAIALTTTAAVALLATACSSSSSGGASPATSGSAAAGPSDHVLHVSFLQDPGGPPDPDVYYAGQGLMLTTNIYEGLLQYAGGTDKPTLAPDLATSWTASSDNKVFTLKLRQGVTFHDGTPFTSAAVKTSFDRRAAVKQGPSYMVADVASVTTQGDFGVTITLKDSNAIFLDYLASPYGPRMMSPTGLAANAGTDHAQKYLLTHDLGTGPYTLTDAKVGTHYALTAYDKYWGAKPYFTSVDIPVLSDISTQQLEFDKGQLALILHDLPSSSVDKFLTNKKVSTYSLPTLMSDYLYINPHQGMFKTQANRVALQKAINLDQIVSQGFKGRGSKALQAYPPHMLDPTLGLQNVAYDPTVLSGIAKTLPAADKTITVGYDTSSVDNQLIANLISAQLGALGLTAKVQGYPTSQIFNWPADLKGAPDMVTTLGWPDAAPAYTWSHISFDPGAGLNFMQCSTDEITALNAEGLKTGDPKTFGTIGEKSTASGCWLNEVAQQDFMVGQTWLKGVEAAHVVAVPNSLSFAKLSAG